MPKPFQMFFLKDFDSAVAGADFRLSAQSEWE